MPINLVAYAIAFLLCIPFGVYFWGRHRGTRLTRWLALIVVMLGLSALQVFLELTLPPPHLTPGIGPWWLAPAWVGVSLLNVLINTFFYYATLVIAMLYNGYYSRWLSAILATPILVTFAFGIDVRVNDLNYHLIAAWGSVYWLAAAGLFVTATLKEQSNGYDDVGIRGSAIAAALLLPSLVLLIHQLQAGADTMLAYVYISCLASLGIFIFLYIRGTLLAIRRELLGRAARLEQAFMEHALKNSIAKVRLHALNIRQGLEAGEHGQVEQYVQRLLATTDQMLSATKSISQSGGAGLVVHGDWHDLQVLVDQAVAPLQAVPGIEIVREDGPCRLHLDPRLVAECLANVLHNSIEALDGPGTITIGLRQTRRHAVLSIRDSGPGINAWAVAHVFQPFYSSKPRSEGHGLRGGYGHYGNYGLGMAYVQAVMKAHRGRAELESEPGDGTVVRLTFPKGDWQGGEV